MAQSTLLSSQVQNRKGFVVSVERTIRLAEFESLRVALSESFPEGMDHDQAYKSIHEQVEQWATAAKPKETLPVVENHAVSPRPAVAKPPSLMVEVSNPIMGIDTIRGRLAKWLDKLEVTSTLNGFAVKPPHFLLRPTWEEIDACLRGLGAKWVSAVKGVGSWIVPA